MLNFLDKYQLIRGQAVFGVELLFTTKEDFTLIALELIATKESVEITRRFLDLTIEKLLEENTKKLPVYFSVGGKGVIHKKVKTDEYTQEQELLNQVLPNASLNDFYIQKSYISETECWVSIIRQDVLNLLIDRVETLNIFGVEIYLGPFSIENSIQLIDQPVILTTSHELLIENDSIVPVGEEYNIDGETVSSHELIAFGTALNHFVSSNKLIPIVINKIKQIKQEYLNKSKYTVVGFSMLILFFLITIINMLVSNSYRSANDDLQYQANSKKKYILELETLRSEFKTKEQFVQNSGVAQASKISYYADQIAMNIPKSIQLNQLFINPLRKRVNKAEDIFFNYNKIRVSGTVSRSIELNNWVKDLKTNEWVEEINIISFLQDNLKNAGEFEIEVNINN